MLYVVALFLWAACLVSGIALAADRPRRAGVTSEPVASVFDALYNLDYGIAIADFRRFIALNLSDPASYVYLGIAYWMQCMSP
ncbi:MAG: hypothetical protein HY644_07670 [Acidobacteria bacterium]|nr:hypothetical protein [Acidobacteriota bacterium]